MRLGCLKPSVSLLLPPSPPARPFQHPPGGQGEQGEMLPGCGMRRRPGRDPPGRGDKEVREGGEVKGRGGHSREGERQRCSLLWPGAKNLCPAGFRESHLTPGEELDEVRGGGNYGRRVSSWDCFRFNQQIPLAEPLRWAEFSSRRDNQQIRADTLGGQRETGRRPRKGREAGGSAGKGREGSGGGGWGELRVTDSGKGSAIPGTAERGEIGSKNSGAYGWVASAGGMDQL
ncbi:uncharacterized protein LOC119699520 [Motacilla alba alba]|uniref:uncharacterized protein LOC119699520 n=1 Tax=Motacilla alba alba TaxID=1094192 RepID=UPI0018D4E4E7|nr:uncharacterized protein LOC119699520 [Motacilla alba alba]